MPKCIERSYENQSQKQIVYPQELLVISSSGVYYSTVNHMAWLAGQKNQSVVENVVNPALTQK